MGLWFPPPAGVIRHYDSRVPGRGFMLTKYRQCVRTEYANWDTTQARNIIYDDEQQGVIVGMCI